MTLSFDPSETFWWEKVQGPGLEAFEEFARDRRELLDRCVKEMEEGDQARRRVRGAIQTAELVVAGAGDFAHWVWIHEAREPERELLRALDPHDRFLRLCALDRGNPGYVGLKFFEGSPRGVALREMSRARSFALDLATGEPGSAQPFPLESQGQMERLRERAAKLHWDAAGALWKASHKAGFGGVALGHAGALAAGGLGGGIPGGLAAMGALCAIFAIKRLGASPKAPLRQLLDDRLRQAYPSLDGQGFFKSLGSAAFFRGGYWDDHFPSMKALIEEATGTHDVDHDGLELARHLEAGKAGAQTWPTRALRSQAESLDLSQAATRPAPSVPKSRL